MFTNQQIIDLGNFKPITDKVPWVTSNPDMLYKKMAAEIESETSAGIVLNMRNCNYMASFIDIFIYPKDESTVSSNSDCHGIIMLLPRLGNFYTLVATKRFGEFLMSGMEPSSNMHSNFEQVSLKSLLPIIHEVARRYNLIELKIEDLRDPVDEEVVSDAVKSSHPSPHTAFDVLYYTDYTI